MQRPFTTPVRIGDAERDAAVTSLNRHFAEGRLTVLEHDERISVALAARTDADLDKLFADLPLLDTPGRSRRRGPVRQVLAVRGVPIPVLLLGVAFALFVVVNLVPILALIVVAIVIRGTVLRLAFGGRRHWQGRRSHGHGW